MHEKAVGSMRTAVHDVRDTAQATVNKAAIEVEMTKLKNTEGS